jgi:Flp pilus assembly pilin Flp
MSRVRSLVRRAGTRAAGERGATAVEYGLLAGIIVVTIAVAVGALGTSLGEIFQGVADNPPFG